jgi:quercetin dioxygenase-like cupin family protein
VNASCGTIRSVDILRFSRSIAERIGQRPYDVRLASSLKLAEGAGEAHAYVIYFEPGGIIGPHEAGYGQILFAVAGGGWVAGADDQRIAIAEGEAAFISRGEVHSKGSESGMTALMVQMRDMTPLAR